jgi:Zn finger protein HypA/HybF involved in hydrogenase expression
MNRKQRRTLQKHVGATAQEKMSQQVTQFGKLPKKCMTCDNAFDKKDKEMIESWNVVVRQEEVRLFCPECIKKTQEVLEDVGR